MTDLISSLADSILALVNSKPQTPSKDEIDSLLRKAIPVFMGNGNILNHVESVHNPHVCIFVPWLSALCRKAGVDFPEELGGEIQRAKIERDCAMTALAEIEDDEEAEGDSAPTTQYLETMRSLVGDQNINQEKLVGMIADAEQRILEDLKKL